MVKPMEIKKINIRGVYFANVTMNEAAAFVEERVVNGETTAIYTPNPEIVQMCIENESFYETINSAELIVPDGIGVVKASRILGTPLKEKVAGIELGEKVLDIAARHGKGVFLFGGKDTTRTESGVSVADQCIPVFEKKFQQSEGSADEKPQTCAFKIWEFSKIGKALGAEKVTYTYILSSWFAHPKYKDMLAYIKTVPGCDYILKED